jgi:hypothetical protein
MCLSFGETEDRKSIHNPVDNKSNDSCIKVCPVGNYVRNLMYFLPVNTVSHYCLSMQTVWKSHKLEIHLGVPFLARSKICIALPFNIKVMMLKHVCQR